MFLHKFSQSLVAHQCKVGNEFSQVEGLWSQFENVMAAKEVEKDDASAKDGAAEVS